jgi:hypothetical protein
MNVAELQSWLVTRLPDELVTAPPQVQVYDD